MIHILENVERWECDYESCDAMCCEEGLQLTVGDIQRIGGRWEEFAFFDEKKKMLRLKGKHGVCIFLDEKLRCKIHEKKPLICQLLPFRIVDVVYADEPIMKLRPAKGCPGYGKGALLNADFKQRIESIATQFLRENQKMLRLLSESKIEEIIESFV
jgi:Fe-S-cluster containining protein